MNILGSTVLGVNLPPDLAVVALLPPAVQLLAYFFEWMQLFTIFLPKYWDFYSILSTSNVQTRLRPLFLAWYNARSTRRISSSAWHSPP